MKNIKKFILLALMVCFIAALCFTAAAETYSGTCGTNVNWLLNTNTGVLEIWGTGPMTEYKSSASVPWLNYRSYINTIIVSSGVTTVGSYAFQYCNSLSRVTLPDSVSYIGKYAFHSSNSLSSINMGNGVTDIGNYAFYNCKSLSNITFPDSLTYIGDRAFSYCTGISSIVLPDNFLEMGEYAFNECSALSSITIPDSVTIIDNYAFQVCTSLKDVYYIGEAADWVRIKFGNNFSNPIHGGANLYFNGKLVTDIVIPESVQNLRSYLFYNCASLKKAIVYNADVTYIGNYVFVDCHEDFTLYGYKGSTTEAYANKRNIPFVALCEEHTFGDYVVTTEPTCTDVGEMTRTCSGCGDVETMTMVEKGHDIVSHPGKEPTFTEVGWEAYETCSRCDYTTYVEIPVSNVQADMDGDGGVTIKDVLDLICVILNDKTIENGDVNGDGKVDLVDVIRVMKMVTK